MTKFLDGPAAGHTLTLRRAPAFLRVTISRIDGKVDALDQLNDIPRLDEDVHVYRREPDTFVRAFVRPGGCYEFGKYRHVPDADVDARDTRAWQAWAEQSWSVGLEPTE